MLKTISQAGLNSNLEPKKGNETRYVIENLNEMVAAKGKRQRPYASGLDCPRKVWFFANTESVATVNPAPMKLYQEIGNAVEDVVVNGFRNNQLLLGSQVKLPNPPKSFGVNVGGYIDMVALDSTGQIAAYEIKTCKTIPNEPKPAHLSQALVYATLGGFDRVHVIYVSRMVQDWPNQEPLVKVFTVDAIGSVLDVATNIIYSCRTMHSKQSPPRPSHFRKHRECQFCDFQARCWDDPSVVTMDPQAAYEAHSVAERVAVDLVALRKHFYLEALSNAKGGAPDYAISTLDKAIAAGNLALRV